MRGLLKFFAPEGWWSALIIFLALGFVVAFNLLSGWALSLWQGIMCGFAADAARYRWLREQHATDIPSWHVRKPTNDVAECDLDAEIDAAILATNHTMAQKKNPHEGG